MNVYCCLVPVIGRASNLIQIIGFLPITVPKFFISKYQIHSGSANSVRWVWRMTGRSSKTRYDYTNRRNVFNLQFAVLVDSEKHFSLLVLKSAHQPSMLDYCCWQCQHSHSLATPSKTAETRSWSVKRYNNAVRPLKRHNNTRLRHPTFTQGESTNTFNENNFIGKTAYETNLKTIIVLLCVELQ